MKIAVVLGGTNPERQRRNPVLNGFVEILRAKGADVTLIEPRLMTYELAAVQDLHDLYVIKSISNPLAASYNATLHAIGAATFNPFPVVQLIRNKIATTRLLAKFRVPVPETFVSPESGSLLANLKGGPLIVKPYMGSSGVGIKRITTREELLALTDDPPIFAQRYHPSDDGLDRKISVIGGKVFGVKRRFPLRTYEDKIGTPLEITDSIRDIVQRISTALTIDMFTFDLMISGGRPYVVDVGAFGGLMGVPGAAEMVAARIIRAWEERVK